MKHNRGFAIQHQSTGTTFLKVARVGDATWRVQDMEIAEGQKGPSPLTAKAVADPQAQVTWLLPNDEVKTFVTSFPRLSRKELRRAVSGWVAREEGGSPNDWSLAWDSLSGGKGGSGSDQEDIFLLYAAREVVARGLKLAAEWNIRPRYMLPGYMVLDQFYRSHGPDASDLDVWNLVFLGRRQNFLCICTRDSLLLTRPLPFDLSEGGDPAEYLGRLATEVDRSVSFARQTEKSPAVEKIIVCGEPDLVRDLVAEMDQKLSTPAMAWDLQAHFDGGEISADPDLLLTLTGAALSLESCPYNLGPGEGPRWGGRLARRRSMLFAGAAGVALVPLLLAGGLATSRVQDTYLQRARGRIAESSEKARKAEEAYQTQRVLLARETRINRFAGRNPDLQSVLLRLAAMTPSQVVYDELRIRELPDGRFFLHLDGAATGGSSENAHQAFLALLKSLDECDFLRGEHEPKELEITGSERDDQGRKSTVFSLEYQLLPPKHQEEG